MTIQAQTADGTIHEFPDGTPDGVVDDAIKTYLQPSLGKEEMSDVGNRLSNLSTDYKDPNLTNLQAGLYGTGELAGIATDTAGNLINRIPGYKDVAGAVSGVAKNAAQWAAQWTANEIDNPTTENMATSTADYLNKNPNIGRSAQAVSNIFGAIPIVGGTINAIKAAPEIASTAAKGAEGLANAYAEKYPETENNPFGEGSTSPPTIKNILPETQAIFNDRGVPSEAMAVMKPNEITKLKNQAYAEGIVGSIQDARTTKNGIYSMANEVGNDSNFDAGTTKNQLDNLHAKYSNDPAYDGTPLVRRLDSWRNMFNDDGTITPTRLNNILDQVQDAYRENPKVPEGEVYSAIQSPLTTAVEQAKQQFPNWGTLISTADDAHYNLLKSIKDDSTFTNKWSPDSQQDFQTVTNKTNNPADLMGDTQRQIANLSKIKDEAELQKTMAFIPKELQPQFLMDVTKNASSPLNVIRFAKSLLYTAKGNLGWGIENAAASLPQKADVMGWDPDAATHITDRMQQYRDTATQAYQNHLEEKQAASGMGATTQYNVRNAQKSLPVSTTQYLPSPDRPYVSDNGIVRPMTDEEWANTSNAPDIMKNRLNKADDRGIYSAGRTASQPPSFKTDINQSSKLINGQSNYTPPTPISIGNMRAMRSGLPAPAQGNRFIASNEGVRPSTSAEDFQSSPAAMKQSQVVWDAKAAPLKNMGYTDSQISQRIGQRPSSNNGTDAEFDEQEKNAKQSLVTLSRKRGGRTLTPAQRRAANKIVGRTQQGRKAA